MDTLIMLVLQVTDVITGLDSLLVYCIQFGLIAKLLHNLIGVEITEACT